MRIVQVSDSHLSRWAPYADANWAAVVEYVRRSAPDLVVHTGDISLDGAGDETELEHARNLLDDLPARWLAIPGNHDIGDFGDTPQPIDRERRLRYADFFGDASWSTIVDGWRVVGVDVQTLASGLDGSAELWSWLADDLARPGPVALFVHRPLWPWTEGEVDHPGRYVTEPARARLRHLVTTNDVRLVASGHVHQWRSTVLDGCAYVWAPSTWASLPDSIQPWIGEKSSGVVEHSFDAAGVTSTLVRPPGLADVIAGDDFASPYSH